ncbi:isoaspartyl peptidase/L-asparaginase family protein [Acanthopleuribacter pedis]|uniref:Isoaspartyl peptidase n=1 Tax=Acanthopleuribacter pedis TaxID=442870 RepID=A0A8J7QP38_9BACT|nr:isoaspartyl peptidase/L-asparaginase [Acanthopleuribacter pedis]MBO1322028.1 isoaspartyl peptidase/L-asparaginase [Acanthopleuribacter pedis]
MTRFAMAVHGGAWNIPDELWAAHQAGCRAAQAAGTAVLAKGGDAVSAVCAAIRVLEDDPTFDAGKGSFLNERGEVELDAGLMEGDQLHYGAVLGVARIQNPIDLARYIMEHNQHCVFFGEGAEALAGPAGLASVDPHSHVLPRERKRFETYRDQPEKLNSGVWRAAHDTVGALARDQHGNLAAGNSTGGIPNKQRNRVGDAALISSGLYADNEMGAAMCTGWGESIMRAGMLHQALAQLKAKGDSSEAAQAAAETAVNHLERRVGGYGGIVVMTRSGYCGAAFNTERMAFELPSKDS